MTGQREPLDQSGFVSGRNCEGCGAELPPPKRAAGRQRKWCSNRCRRVTLYAGSCVDCGNRTDGSEGPGKAAQRCLECSSRHLHENRRWNQETIIVAIQEWAARYGSPPSAGEWNTTLARRGGRRERSTGYPPATTVQREFGSWSAALAAAGFQPRQAGMYGRPGEDPAVIAETVRLYRSGLRVAEVARRMDIAEPTLYHRLRAAGEPTRRAQKAAA